MDGAREFVTALGLEIAPDLSTARVPYPYQNGVETFKINLDILQRTWKKLAASARYARASPLFDRPADGALPLQMSPGRSLANIQCSDPTPACCGDEPAPLWA